MHTHYDEVHLSLLGDLQNTLGWELMAHHKLGLAPEVSFTRNQSPKPRPGVRFHLSRILVQWEKLDQIKKHNARLILSCQRKGIWEGM